MPKSVVIPSTANPWVCNINGVVYSYASGNTQTVPDEVAELIDNINDLKTEEAVRPGVAGQVWTRDANGKGYWASVPQYTLTTATSSKIGGLKQGVAVADAASTAPTAAEFKALFDSLRTAGIIATAT